MHAIKLTDGTLLENLELNGNNYIAEIAILDSVFDGNLATVEISDGETVEVYANMKLLSNIAREGRSWIVIGQKSQEEIEKEVLEEKNEELELVVGDLTQLLIDKGVIY